MYNSKSVETYDMANVQELTHLQTLKNGEVMVRTVGLNTT